MNAQDQSPVEHSSPVTVRLALALFCGSLVSLLLFSLLPSLGGNQAGWIMWLSILEVFQMPALLSDPESQMFVASVLTVPVLVIASPFLTGMYLKSRLTWWLATLVAGTCTPALWSIILFGDAWPSFGIWCLLAAPALNLAGLLSLRLAKRPEDPIR